MTRYAKTMSQAIAEMQELQLERMGYTPKEIKMAIGIASDPRYKQGNYSGAVKQIEKIKKGLSTHKQVAAVLKRQNENLEEKYDLYHKDFSSAMQHAYDYAQKKLGITVDKSEIDRKVATGPKKPTEGKTNKYRLKGKGGNLQIQVYNKGGSKPFELNMYKEEFESDLDENKVEVGLDEAKLPTVSDYFQFFEFGDEEKKYAKRVGLKVGKIKNDSNGVTVELTGTLDQFEKMADKFGMDLDDTVADNPRMKISMRMFSDDEQKKLNTDKYSSVMKSATPSKMNKYFSKSGIQDEVLSGSKSDLQKMVLDVMSLSKAKKTFKSDKLFEEVDLDEAKFQVNYSKGGKLFSKSVNAKNEDDAEDKAIKQFKIEDDDIRSVVKEASARADAMRAMGRGRKVDPADIDEPKASDTDKKSAMKNMIMQMRQSLDSKGTKPIEFADGKSQKVDPKILTLLTRAHDKIQKPRDKEKFVTMISKSYRDMLNVSKMVGKQLRMGEDVELDEASKEGTIKIIKTKNGKFQIQKMTKGKFVDIGKPHNSAKEAEKFRSGQPDLFGEDVELDEGMAYKFAAVDRLGKVIGFASDEKDAKDMARRNKGRVVTLTKPLPDNKKSDMMVNRPLPDKMDKFPTNTSATQGKRMGEGVEMNELKMNDPKLNKIFDKLKPKSTIQIKKSSSIGKDQDFSTYLVMNKNTLRNGTEKITLKNRANPAGVKSFLYRRDGKVTFAIGDMGASIDDIKEAKDDFKPHMMYDPKTGKGYKAETEEDHLRMKDMGYTHDKPEIKEAKFSDDMINKLKKAYEPMKGKKINPTPLMKIFDKIDSNKDGLEQLYKADIPFVSMMAMSRLMLKHNYKAADINKLGKIRREEFKESEMTEKLTDGNLSLKDTVIQMWKEAVSPEQQAAIAISKKEKGEKPKKENNFIFAAKMAKKNGEKTFTIGGKEYDVEEALNSETNKNDKSDDGDGLDAVQPKAVKKKFTDRKDKDIDNDGDVDDSDKFLHKRRKAVSKAINSQKENVELDEALKGFKVEFGKGNDAGMAVYKDKKDAEAYAKRAPKPVKITQVTVKNANMFDDPNPTRKEEFSTVEYERYLETKRGSLRDSILKVWGEDTHGDADNDDEDTKKKDLTKSKKDGTKKMTDTGKEITPVDMSPKMPKVKNERNRV